MALEDFDYEFVAEPDDSLKCSICLEVAKEPKQEEVCGKLFCKGCIEKNGNKPCPNCNTERPQYFNDKRSLREIRELCVKCGNVGKGCDWEGAVGTLNNHVTKCGFTLVSCPNKCKVEGGDLQLMRKVLDDHLKTKCPNRDHKCEHCGEKGRYVNIIEEHDQVCRNKLVPCPNTECTLTMERGKINEHVCMFTEVTCKYNSIGCNVRKVRMHMKQHEEDDDKAHLHMALQKIAKLDCMVSLLQSTSENASLITTMCQDISSLKDTTTSLKGTTTSLMEKSNCTASLSNNITSLRTSLSSVKKITTSLEKDVNVINKRESFTFKMSEYNWRKEEAETYYSDSFYTSRDGYRVHIRVDPNGSGDHEGTHVSVYAKLLKGSNDFKLQWPFLGSMTIELLNQLADDNHHSMTISFDIQNGLKIGTAYGYTGFIPHLDLSPVLGARNTRYLVEDTLYFRVTVKVDSHMPWLECTQQAK